MAAVVAGGVAGGVAVGVDVGAAAFAGVGDGAAVVTGDAGVSDAPGPAHAARIATSTLAAAGILPRFIVKYYDIVVIVQSARTVPRTSNEGTGG